MLVMSVELPTPHLVLSGSAATGSCPMSSVSPVKQWVPPCPPIRYLATAQHHPAVPPDLLCQIQIATFWSED